jgi:diguanylate cyclase (GGDEF)-like protein
VIENFECFSHSYNLWLVLLAVVVCVSASFATFTLLPRLVAERRSGGATVWVALTTVTAAAGIWSTLFIAMLAFHPHASDVGFDRSLTVLSLVLTMAIVGVSMTMIAAASRRFERIAGAAGLGATTVLMHYAGVSGMVVAGHVGWSLPLVALSTALSLALAISAVMVCGDGEKAGQRGAGAVLFGLSILMLHSIGMAAIAIQPDPTMVLPRHTLSGTMLGYAVAGGTLLVVAAAATAFAIDYRVRRDSDARFRYFARHDMLTRLSNRLHFEELASRELVAAAFDGRPAAILCLDLDGFKDVNDIFGHAAGDEVLVRVAERLRGLLGDRCVAARLGGDAFAVLVASSDDDRTAAEAARSIIDALTTPYAVQGALLNVGCSIGVAAFPADGETLPLLLARADLALSKAKQGGRGRIRVFDMAMDDALRERSVLAADLRNALASGELSLHFQPQFDIVSRSVGAFEALLRWDHPLRGAIAPALFIPIAEETGLIVPIGAWVLRTACEEAARWGQAHRIAVNLSVAQMREVHIVETIRAILADTGLAPQRLEIEITESLLLENTPRTVQTLRAIQALGVRISMDDFGTGVSSLSTLAAFDFDTIKIDRSFTAQLGLQAKTTAIVNAIVALARNLTIEIVAEGVETTGQLAMLSEIGCTAAQGYLLGRPKPIADYARHLPAHPPARSDAKIVHLRSA